MYKEISEDIIKEKVAEILKKQHQWKRVCLLLLLVPKPNKLVSKYFIYDKIQEWGLWNPLYEQGINVIAKHRANTLATISRTLHDLFLNGYLRKEDLGRESLPQKEFEKICRERVLGRPEHLKLQKEASENPKQSAEGFSKWINSAYFLSPEGRDRAKEILFPPKIKNSRSPLMRRHRGNQKSTTRA